MDRNLHKVEKNLWLKRLLSTYGFLEGFTSKRFNKGLYSSSKMKSALLLKTHVKGWRERELL